MPAIEGTQISHLSRAEEETMCGGVSWEARASNDVSPVIYGIRKALSAAKRSKVGYVIGSKGRGTQDAIFRQGNGNDCGQANTEGIFHDAPPRGRSSARSVRTGPSPNGTKSSSLGACPRITCRIVQLANQVPRRFP